MSGISRRKFLGLSALAAATVAVAPEAIAGQLFTTPAPKGKLTAVIALSKELMRDAPHVAEEICRTHLARIRKQYHEFGTWVLDVETDNWYARRFVHSRDPLTGRFITGGHWTYNQVWRRYVLEPPA